MRFPVLQLVVLVGTYEPTGSFRREATEGERPRSLHVQAARLLSDQNGGAATRSKLFARETAQAVRGEQLAQKLGLEEELLSQATIKSLGSSPHEDVHQFAHAFGQSFTLMCTAEIFDRTWFVTLLASMHHGPLLTFFASFSALALHSVMAVTFGGNVAKMLPKWALELIAAILLMGFAIIYAWECYTTVPGQDILTRRKLEAEEEAAEELAAGANPQEEDAPLEAAGCTKRWQNRLPRLWGGFAAVFSMIFIAEWGDRTQLVQITLAAALPWVPVLLGSLAGLFLLCLSAATLARFLEGWSIEERLVNLFCAVAFGIMAVIAVYNATQEPGFPGISAMLAQVSSMMTQM